METGWSAGKRWRVRTLLVAIIVAGVILTLARTRPMPGKVTPMPVAPVLSGSCIQRCPAPSALPASPVRVACHEPPQADSWTTYGHDARRTSTGAGCVGALRTAWRYVPYPPGGWGLQMVFHAVGTPQGVFLEWGGSGFTGGWLPHFVGSTAFDGIAPDGTHLWTFDSGRDAGIGEWPSLGFGKLLMNDDGTVWIDPQSGATPGDQHSPASSNDIFGETLIDPSLKAWISVNEAHLDRDTVYLQAATSTANDFSSFEGGPVRPLWRVNTLANSCQSNPSDETGGIAEDGGTVFYAPHYTDQGVTLPLSGVYAVDAATGTRRWFVPATPGSRVSAGTGSVYLVEGSDLTALDQVTGQVRWRQALRQPSSQAPVVAGNEIVTADGGGVTAFDARDGARLWAAPMTGAAAPLTTIALTTDCSASNPGSSRTVTAVAATTTLAAAGGSQTLVVAAASGLRVLSLRDGRVIWSGPVAGQRGPLRDPVLVGDTVYAVDQDGLLALTASP